MKAPRSIAWLAAWLALVLGARLRAGELWFYAAENLAVNERVDRLEAVLRRAHAAGYTHVLISDPKPGEFARRVQRSR